MTAGNEFPGIANLQIGFEGSSDNANQEIGDPGNRPSSASRNPSDSPTVAILETTSRSGVAPFSNFRPALHLASFHTS